MIYLCRVYRVKKYSMASINGQLVREEAERIKSEFDRITKNKKVDDDSRMLFKSMLMLINLLIAIFLEKNTEKNSKNSSKPPSQTDKDESSITKNGTNGKGKLENNALANNTRTVETVSLIKVTQCDVCGENLEKVHCEHIERRTKIDIIFEKTVDHVDAQIKHCPACDTTVKGQFPADMPGPLQYGNGLKAYIISLSDAVVESRFKNDRNDNRHCHCRSESFKVCVTSLFSARNMGSRFY